MRFIKDNFFLLLLSLIVLLLTIIWFSKGLLIGTGESAVPFYTHAQNILVTRHTWSFAILGSPTSFTLAYYPYFFAIDKLITIFNDPVLVQAAVFFLVLLCAVLSMYILCLRIALPNNKFGSFISSIFYLFNTIMVVLVLNRLQYPLIFLYAVLPLGLWLFIEGINRNKFVYLVYLNLALLVFATAFALLSASLLFWMIIAFYSLYSIFYNYKNGQKVKFIFLYTAGAWCVWLLLNCWWLGQLTLILSGNSYLTTQAYTTAGNISGFNAISEKLGNLSYVFRLIHKDFFIEIQPVWGKVYQSTAFIIATYVIPFLAFLPLIVKKKPKIILFFLGVALVLVFLTKGSAEPFGQIFGMLFANLRILELFRNPFEKIGIALPLVYAPLIGYSITLIKEKVIDIKAKNYKFVYTSIILSLFGVISFPMLNRWVFTSPVPPANNKKVGYYVKVPGYYKLASSWLNKDKSNFRVIALPLSGEGVNFLWEYGYAGVEFSNGLFEKSFISHSTTSQFLDDITSQLEKLLYKSPSDFYKAVNLLNAKYVMIRHDINFDIRKLHNPQEEQDLLETKATNIKKSEEFDKLRFYTLSEDEYLPKIFATNSVITLSDNATNLYSDLLPLANYSKGTIFVKSRDDHNTNIFSNQTIVQTEILHKYKLNISPENSLAELPSVRVLPTDSTYGIVLFKEQFEKFLARGEEKEFFDLNLSSKRLVELQTLLQKNEGIQTINVALDRYKKSLTLLDGNLLFNNTRAKQILLRQYYVLEKVSLDKNNPKLKGIRTYLEKLCKDNHIRTIFPSLEYTYRFSIDEPGDYELIMDSADMPQFYNTPQTIQVQTDGISESIPFDSSNKFVIGKKWFNRGEHEVSLGKLSARNLLKGTQAIMSLQSSSKEEQYVFPADATDNFSEYTLSFQYRLVEGIMPTLSVSQRTDQLDQNRASLLEYTALSQRENLYTWLPYYKIISPEKGGYDMKVNFGIKPWNNCSRLNQTVFFRITKCNSPETYNLYNQKSLIEINDLKLEKDFNQPLSIIKNNSKTGNSTVPKIDFKQLSPAQYSIHVKNATQPFVLVFSESYHPLWEASVEGSHINESKHFIANNYANAWRINKQGDFEINLKFKAEDTLEITKIIALSTLVSLLVIVVVTRVKRNHG